MPSFADPTQHASFLAYLHYLEDIAGLVGGTYGLEASLVEGVYQVARTHPAGPPPPAILRRLNDELSTTWRNLVRLEQLTAPATYDRQANATLPRFAFEAVVAAVRALAVVEGVDLDPDPRDALDYAAGRISEGVLAPPWSSRCLGCPATGSTQFADIVPGEVDVFAAPDPATSAARLALLLRTTRARVLQQAFAEARRQRVRPGRTRRNLSVEDKEAIAFASAPTTLLDVFARLAARAAEDGGDAFVDGALDEVDAFRFAEALRTVTDATVAALEAAVAGRVSFELLAELVASHLRRSGVHSATLRRREAAACRMPDRWAALEASRPTSPPSAE